MNKALIVIDMQNDYFTGGKMELNNINSALNNTLKLVDYAHKNSFPIYFIKHISNRADATFFLANSNGVKLHKSLNTSLGKVITKHYPNSFKDTNLNSSLKDANIDNLIICGAMSHMCIDSTVRAGFDLGYKIELVYDACATKDLSFNKKIIKADDVHLAFMAALDGTFCKVKSTKEFLK